MILNTIWFFLTPKLVAILMSAVVEIVSTVTQPGFSSPRFWEFLDISSYLLWDAHLFRAITTNLKKFSGFFCVKYELWTELFASLWNNPPTLLLETLSHFLCQIHSGSSTRGGVIFNVQYLVNCVLSACYIAHPAASTTNATSKFELINLFLISAPFLVPYFCNIWPLSQA